MTAPVCGSGRCPPCMTRVAKRSADLSSLICGGSLQSVTSATGESASQLAPQPVEQIDTRDEPLELAALHDDRDHAALEDLHQLRHRGIDRHRHQVARHGLGYRLVEV